MKSEPKKFLEKLTVIAKHNKKVFNRKIDITDSEFFNIVPEQFETDVINLMYDSQKWQRLNNGFNLKGQKND